MKVYLYWRLTDRVWFYSFEELNLSYNPDGIETRGVYEISHPQIKPVSRNEETLLDYAGDDKLHELYATQGKVVADVRPYIVDYNTGKRVYLKKEEYHGTD